MLFHFSGIHPFDIIPPTAQDIGDQSVPHQPVDPQIGQVEIGRIDPCIPFLPGITGFILPPGIERGDVTGKTDGKLNDRKSFLFPVGGQDLKTLRP